MSTDAHPHTEHVRSAAGNSGAPRDGREQRIQLDPQEALGQGGASPALGAVIPNALTAFAYAKNTFRPLELEDAVDALSSSVKRVQSGEMSDAESMLMGQAVALNSIFNVLAVEARYQKSLKQMEAYFRMSMKAQANCRLTLETLSTIKNPPVVFVRQANIAHGAQQVNNASPDFLAHAANQKRARNELLKDDDGERVVSGKTRKAGRANSDVEAVGKIHRPPLR